MILSMSQNQICPNRPRPRTRTRTRNQEKENGVEDEDEYEDEDDLNGTDFLDSKNGIRYPVSGIWYLASLLKPETIMASQQRLIQQMHLMTGRIALL
jgi:hypothetical protein